MRKLALLTVLAALAAATASGGEGEARQPVYVGVRACAACHQGEGMGHTFSRWLLSKHAHAFAALADPAALKIAELSGVPQKPQESVLCLGCHATGANAEPWEKDETFFVEDGVQCERCHGPGSEYAEAAVMTNAPAAERAGLIRPALGDCENCHQPKGSHDAVLSRPRLNLTNALEAIAHPTPREWKQGTAPEPPPRHDAKTKYVGVRACGSCHRGREQGHTFSRWRMSAHADAYAVLATPAARAIAEKQGVQAPQESAVCLACHATAYHDPQPGTLPSYAPDEGVGCEACHGAGSAYSPADVMRDKAAAKAAGLREVSAETCLGCHRSSHAKPFDYEAARQAIAHPTKLPPLADSVRYKTPLNLALSPDGRELFVACEASDSVMVVDTDTRKKVAEIEVGRHATDVAFSPDGRRAYVSSRLDDSVSVVDTARRTVLATIAVGDEPHGLLTDRDGRYLYVLNTSSDSISVIDTASLKEVKRLAAGRSPWSLALSPDGKRILLTNNLQSFAPLRTPSDSEVTVIDTQRCVVESRWRVPDANLMQGVAWHPSGRFALVTLNRTKSLVPMTRLLQGWTITNGLGILWADGRVDQVLLDEPGLYFPDAADVAFSPDGRLAFVTSSGSDRVAVLDVRKLVTLLERAPARERAEVIPNHLGKSAEFVVAHIETKQSPRGILAAPDGKTVYVAAALDDSLTVIDVSRRAAVGRIDLGGPEVVTQARRGERLFHSANIAFQRQFSCHSCHPDGHIDGITYDIEADGIGISPVDNRTLRGILDTAPFKWEGTNPSLQRQCGARLAVFFTRVAPFTPEELAAVDRYICTIPRPPNRYRPLGAELTPAQRRGKVVFQRVMTNDGRVIPREQRCITCHPPPLYTDRKRHVVGRKHPLDRGNLFDTPHLLNIYDSAPYLHNGSAATLEQIWTEFNPYDEHGISNDMTKDQLNDLIEYLKTL